MMDEDQIKEMKELMERFYDKDGNLTEEGKEMVKEDYIKAYEFDIELTELCNKYVNEMNSNIFAYVWVKVQEGIKMVHEQRMQPPIGKPPENIFG